MKWITLTAATIAIFITVYAGLHYNKQNLETKQQNGYEIIEEEPMEIREDLIQEDLKEEVIASSSLNNTKTEQETKEAEKTEDLTATEEIVDRDSLIKGQLDRLLQALVEQDGKTVASLVDKNTLNFYQDLTNLANYGTKEQILAQPTMIGGSAVLVRIILRENNLTSLSGYDTISYGTTYGRVVSIPSGVFNFHYTKLLTPETADIYFVHEGESYNGAFTATLESGTWKINMMSVLQVATDVIEDDIENTQTRKEELVNFMALTRGANLDDIWTPLLSENE